ncbi:MAG: hypothetical protein Q9182_001102 [Xanthomendoza sp. 2 TL-2023]
MAMSELEGTLFMPSNEFDSMNTADLYNFNQELSSHFPEPSPFAWQPSQAVFDNNAAPMGDGMFDPSTGATWQPMETPESSIDPALLTFSDPFLDPSSNAMPAAFPFAGQDVVFPSQSLNYFDPTLYAPFSPEIPSRAPTYPLSPLQEAEPYFLPTEPKPSTNKPKSKKTPRTHKTPPRTQTKLAPSPPPAPKKNQFQVSLADPGCWCTLCTNPTPIINSFDLAILKNRPLTKPKAAKTPQPKAFAAKASRAKNPAPAKQSLKRKARDEESESESESELSELQGFSDETAESEEVSEDEYEPARKTIKTAPAKRMRAVRGKAVGTKEVPKGLGINMKGW